MSDGHYISVYRVHVNLPYPLTMPHKNQKCIIFNMMKEATETETETETISPGHACGCECKQYFNKNATV